jgi:hypothetical protein
MKIFEAIKGIWNIKRGHFKQRMGYWSNDTMLFEGGRKQEMYGKFLVRHSKKKKVNIPGVL